MASPTRLKSLRLPAPLARSIETEAKRSRRSFSDVTIEMLEESARTRQYRHVVLVGPQREAGWTEEAVARAMPWSKGRAARR